MDELLLALILLLPLAGALLVGPLGGRGGAKVVAMVVLLAELALVATLLLNFDAQTDARRYGLAWSGAAWTGGELRFAVDGLNAYLLLLTAVLFPAVLGCGWRTPEAQTRLYPVLLLLLQAGLLGTFLTQNLLLLFILWEAVLLPMVLIILLWGGPDRRRAAMRFFLYTMGGSVLFLAAVLVLGATALQHTGRWSFDLALLQSLPLGQGTEAFVFFAIVLACAVKSPLFPFHAWLPLAYGQSSAAGTALMAGVLSKMGAYGLLRLAIPLCPTVAQQIAPVLVGLAVVSIVYGAVLALRQDQLRTLVAYASLSHMGYIVLGLFSFQTTAAHGALFQILSHGLSVAGLFLLIGLLEQRRGADTDRLDALSLRAPRLAVLMMLFILASLALPLTSGFTAEFLVLLGAVTQGLAVWRAEGGPWLLVLALVASSGVVLGATYMLRMARSLLFGRPTDTVPLPDLRRREALALVPLVVLIGWIGIWPAPFMRQIESDVAALAQPTPALTARAAAPTQEAGHGR